VFAAPKQQPRQLSVVVIGAGWYGCHIGRSLLKQGCKVSVLEAENRVFSGESCV
jgi:monoamine oxidase